MASRPRSTGWRRAGIVPAALLLLTGSAVTPAAALAAGPPACGVESTGAAARARPDALHPHDPNELTSAQVRERERHLRAALRERARGRAAGPSVRADVTIPVFVHIIQRDDTREGGNIPDEFVTAQLDVLNRAFSAASPFSFALQDVARVTNPAWYPIVRNSAAELEMKNQLRRGGNDTLNIYLGELNADLLGWATFPGTGDRQLDGVVVRNETLPGGRMQQYNEGDTATHEVGHWLNLYHTFQGGCDDPGDHVADTPAEAAPARGCPEGQDTCEQPGADPVHNFMNYSSDACIDHFTSGQVDRMVDAWHAYRAP
jgi:hypothetical protein